MYHTEHHDIDGNWTDIAIESMERAAVVTPALSSDDLRESIQREAWRAAVWVIDGVIDNEGHHGDGKYDWESGYYAADVYDYGYLDVRLEAIGATDDERDGARELMYRMIEGGIAALVAEGQVDRSELEAA